MRISGPCPTPPHPRLKSYGRVAVRRRAFLRLGQLPDCFACLKDFRPSVLILTGFVVSVYPLDEVAILTGLLASYVNNDFAEVFQDYT